ncbi:MAG: UDP-N-acetylmuramate--L-alanine ligase [Minisyncoccus archaeiphilus]|uniref:UDP-N-acetylmuramate--L-alanine ligase n=1 Tax=Minisyncoccus archaeiphilus TaxID=3238481 RepID=UPI0009CDFFC7|nr:MAG: UDP-N-acetylmuramate--L-alanine ligase [Parcubacteria group bacterium ADurb.Bin216]GMX59620.1 MAG: UDP-N-acetylmuramate--L-alanine ligase [Candidatus Parcubacteria bacterium]
MKYFLGIGGIGVSALARFYLSQGEKVVGSDSCDSEIIQDLKKEGAVIYLGHDAQNIPVECNELIYTPAAKDDNPEMIEARKRGLEVLSYPQALGRLSQRYKTIAIAGTHGKSTTTAMLGLMMVEAGMDPTIIVGTKIKEFGNSNFRAGNSEYLVIEACEHEGSFLNYHPQIAIVTNVEADHLDYYGDIDNLRKAFLEFVSHIPADGLLVERQGTELLCECKKQTFSLSDEEVSKIREVIGVPGDHNLLNGLAAYRVGTYLGIDNEVMLRVLNSYIGSWRRFDVTDMGSYVLIDDYAHHPTEIRATLLAAKEKYPDKRICCVYQPHQYQRTKFLFSDFIQVFKECVGRDINKIFMLDVYDVVGREGDDDMRKNYGSERLCQEIGSEFCSYIGKGEGLEEIILGYDVVIMMGAGNVYDLSQRLKAKNCPCS